MQRFYPIVLAILFFAVSGLPDGAFAQVGWTKAYDNAVVVTAEARASETGRTILQQGGNAVDAAVAVQFALAVTLPRAGNIGGGGFMVLRMADGNTKALDFREKAPIRATRDMFIRNGEYDPELSRQSVLASGVPGVVDGMIKALDRFGRLPLETVMEPAIKLAREGYPLSWKQAETLNNHAENLQDYESSKAYFTKPDGSPFEEGDLFIQLDLANTLERIASRGRDGFYSGQTADFIVREMKKHGGLISYKDLLNYESVWRNPITVSSNGFDLHIMPPPSSGSIAIAQILKMLEPYQLNELGFNSAEYIHLLTESMRRAFADRAYFLGDPDYVEIPAQTLLSDEYNRNRMKDFSWNNAGSSSEIGHGSIPEFSESDQTTHFSVVDKQGNAVAVTTTLNGSFGNKIAVTGAGFLLNNEMDDFTAEPGEPNMFGLIQGKANTIEPGKRMLSSMTPTLVTQNGTIKMVLGAAGGPRIITAILQNFLNISVFGMNAQEALAAPRIHHQWLPDELRYESYAINKDTKLILENRGHHLVEYGDIGRSHIVYIDADGKRHGAPDPRGDGHATGY